MSLTVKCLLAMSEYLYTRPSNHKQFNEMNGGLARVWQATRLLSLLQLGDNGPTCRITQICRPTPAVTAARCQDEWSARIHRQGSEVGTCSFGAINDRVHAAFGIQL